MNNSKICLNGNIIVGVMYKRKFDWYISDKEIWILDYEKRVDIYRKMGFELKEEYIDEKRKDFMVLDSSNINKFLNRISEQKATTNDLREILNENKEADVWPYEVRPSLYINFDTCTLYSLYSESESYEDYVPIGWKGMFYDFIDIIPESYKYWSTKLINKGR